MIVVARDLPQPVSVVWSELSQLGRHSEWMTDAESIDFATEQRYDVGTTLVVRTRVGPFVTTDILEVWDWSVAERIGVFHRGLVSGIGMFVLVPIESGTRVVWWEDLFFPWFLGGAVTARLSRAVLARIWRANLERFAAGLG